jgi:hypothetical protein
MSVTHLFLKSFYFEEVSIGTPLQNCLVLFDTVPWKLRVPSISVSTPPSPYSPKDGSKGKAESGFEFRCIISSPEFFVHTQISSSLTSGTSKSFALSLPDTWESHFRSAAYSEERQQKLAVAFIPFYIIPSPQLSLVAQNSWYL